ncbi:hypothetical protein L1987_57732 [Smallanthus sonchifolius]|uniref:Uncharacterized protein n=1 Tax=Smallanthus sonchifolius TaxID=185202 RepID=A0ACB9DDF0_9ASTR|nr:hypothetical protein L1987_57732 [Smallanthus sonchifolius]
MDLVDDDSKTIAGASGATISTYTPFDELSHDVDLFEAWGITKNVVVDEDGYVVTIQDDSSEVSSKSTYDPDMNELQQKDKKGKSIVIENDEDKQLQDFIPSYDEKRNDELEKEYSIRNLDEMKTIVMLAEHHEKIVAEEQRYDLDELLKWTEGYVANEVLKVKAQKSSLHNERDILITFLKSNGLNSKQFGRMKVETLRKHAERIKRENAKTNSSSTLKNVEAENEKEIKRIRLMMRKLCVKMKFKKEKH